MTLRDADLPSIFRSADQRSASSQRAVLMGLTVSLVGVVVAAVFAAITLRSGSIDWAGVIASVAFVLATAATGWILLLKPETRWYDARAVAESAKTLAWQYAVGGGEFGRSGDEPAVRARFVGRLRELTEGLGDLRLNPVDGGEQVPQALEDMRARTLDQRRQSYLEGRIRDQCGWYGSKSRWNERRRIIWAVITVGLLGIGLVFGIAKAFFEFDTDLVGPAAAAAGAAMAWTRSKDFAALAAAYAVTVEELQLIEAEPLPGEEADWAVFVERAERAISREHTLWKARRGSPRMGP